jgi:hypothetical protein
MINLCLIVEPKIYCAKNKFAFRCVMAGYHRGIIELAHCFIIIFFCSGLSAQDTQQKFNISGYISDMQSVTFDSVNKQWGISNLVHNRVNVKYFPVVGISAALELRNRFSMEGNATNNSTTATSFSTDHGFFDWSKNIAKGNSYVLNSSIDRFWVAYERGKFRATLGRQRINWGQTMVWNPNDIFNAYSFFDFDYVERPGSDALRLQYYNSEVSSIELAVKMNSDKAATAAALYRFNVFEYDFQVLAGMLNQTDYIAGFGWSGAIKKVSFRGEVSYFYPEKNFKDTTGLLLASISLDYTFSNSLSLLAEYLYNGSKLNGAFSFQSFYNAPLTVKNLSFVKHNLVGQASYPITPLLTGSLACMFLPEIKGYYLGPSISCSITQNLDASLYLQSFGGKVAGQTLQFNMVYLRLKYSF